MLTERDYYDLPDDAGLAFVQLEKKLRLSLLKSDSKRKKLPTINANSFEIREYVTKILAADAALELNNLNQWEPPSKRLYNESAYLSFISAVDTVIMTIKLRNLRKERQYSVPLDASSREKLRQYILRIKEIIDNLQISEKKRNALLAKIHAFEREIEHDRTRYEIAMGLILETADITGQAAEKLKPLKRLIDSVANLLAKAHQIDQEYPRLPSPRDFRIPDPTNRQLPPPATSDDTEA
jgi:hypothetical protein